MFLPFLFVVTIAASSLTFEKNQRYLFKKRMVPTCLRLCRYYSFRQFLSPICFVNRRGCKVPVAIIFSHQFTCFFWEPVRKYNNTYTFAASISNSTCLSSIYNIRMGFKSLYYCYLLSLLFIITAIV